VVGDRFREDANDPARRWRNAIVKAMAGAALAFGMAALVVYFIESHRLPPARAKPIEKDVGKPVTVEILPPAKSP
jgi:hypothetical protein